MFVSSSQIAFLHSVVRPFVYIGNSAELTVTKKLSQVIKNLRSCHFMSHYVICYLIIIIIIIFVIIIIIITIMIMS